MQVYSLTTISTDDLDQAMGDGQAIYDLVLTLPTLFTSLKDAKEAAQVEVPKAKVKWAKTPGGKWEGEAEGTDMLFVICRVEVR